MGSLGATWGEALLNRRGWRRVARFATVGAAGTVVDVGLFALLHVVLAVAAAPANVVSYSAGIVNNYLLHRRWTYADRPQRPGPGQFFQFLLVSLTALALNTLIVLWLSQPLAIWLGRPGLGALVAKLCATAVGMIWNFVANTWWTFRHSGVEPGAVSEDGDDQ